MAVSIIMSSPKFNIPRSYCRGFVFVSEVENLRFESNIIRFRHPPTNAQAYLVVRPRFKPWSSNWYTLDYVFDGDQSQWLINGVPQVAGVIVSWGGIINEGERRIVVQHSGTTTQENKLNLPDQPGDFWYPISPDV